MERLAVAADEIFALFERTFAEYEEEFLRSKLAQPPRVELTVVHPLTVLPDVKQSPETIQELQNPSVIKVEEPSLELQVCALPVEESTKKSTILQQELIKEQRLEVIVEQRKEAEPGCSLDSQLDNNKPSYSCSDTDDSDDWESAAVGEGKGDEQDPDVVLIEDSNTERNYENTPLSIPSFSGNRNITIELQNQGFLHHPISSLRTGKKSYKCSVCSKVFDQKAHLKQHMQEEKSFSCPECGLRLSNKHKMHRHISAVHRKEKPHKCSVCQTAFAQKSNLISHMRTHTGEKPFVCVCCGKDFRSRTLLNKHIQTHALGETFFSNNSSS